MKKKLAEQSMKIIEKQSNNSRVKIEEDIKSLPNPKIINVDNNSELFNNPLHRDCFMKDKGSVNMCPKIDRVDV